ncbi:MAG: cyclic nucleotide-binding domain-containing protein [Rhodomicrobium sp.]
MQGFDAQNPPFDRLTRDEMDRLGAAMDIGYFAPGATIVKVGEGSDFLHVIIKGAVEERNAEEVAALLGPKDAFDSGSVVHGSASANFVATEETLCFLLPKETILGLVKKNQAFAAFFYTDLSRRLDAFAANQRGRKDSTLCFERGSRMPAGESLSSSRERPRSKRQAIRWSATPAIPCS